MAEIGKIEMLSFTTPALATKTVSFVFASADADKLDQVMDELAFLPKGEMYVAHLDEWPRFFDAICQAKEKHNIKNGALAMIKILDAWGRENF